MRRYPLLPLVDDSGSAVNQLGLEAAASLWTPEPPRTRGGREDAASASPAEHLARLDEWVRRARPSPRDGGSSRTGWGCTRPRWRSRRCPSAIAVDSQRPPRDVDAVEGSLPGTDAEAQRHLEGAALDVDVDVASARFLLAWTLVASGVETDADDITVLYRQVGFTTVEEGLELVGSTSRGRPVAARTPFLLEEIVASLDDEGGTSKA